MLVDRILILLSFLILACAGFYMLYFYIGDETISAISVILSIASFLISTYEFIKKNKD
jgi:hypothetical protein